MIPQVRGTAKQIEAFHQAWAEAGHDWAPRVSVSRSIMPITTDEDRMYFGADRNSSDQVGQIEENLRAVFGRGYAAEPDQLVEQLAEDEGIAAADTLLLTVPNQLGWTTTPACCGRSSRTWPPGWAGAEARRSEARRSQAHA